VDQAVTDAIIDKAVKEIMVNAGSAAVIVRVLSRVFSEGYGYGLSQGHHDRDFPEG